MNRMSTVDFPTNNLLKIYEDLETIHVALVFILLVTFQVLQVKSQCLHQFSLSNHKKNRWLHPIQPSLMCWLCPLEIIGHKSTGQISMFAMGFPAFSNLTTFAWLENQHFPTWHPTQAEPIWLNPMDRPYLLVLPPEISRVPEYEYVFIFLR